MAKRRYRRNEDEFAGMTKTSIRNMITDIERHAQGFCEQIKDHEYKIDELQKKLQKAIKDLSNLQWILENRF